MQKLPFTRRDVLKASAAATVGLIAGRYDVRAAAPEPTPVTAALIEAAKKEGKVVWYAAMDLPVSERVARAFEAKYPGITVRIERTGSERQFQRLEPLEVVYPEEGTPLAASPSAVFKAAPNPNAARLFQNWMHSREAQQVLVDWARQYSPHRQTVEKPGVRKLSEIKLMKEDPEGIEKGNEEIKRRYAQIFKV